MVDEYPNAKYEVGQKVMGFHKPLVGESYPLCGFIKKIWVSSKTYEKNYTIESVGLGADVNLSGTLVEDEIHPFNGTAWDFGYDAWKQYTIFAEKAKEHRKISILHITRRQK